MEVEGPKRERGKVGIERWMKGPREREKKREKEGDRERERVGKSVMLYSQFGHLLQGYQENPENPLCPETHAHTHTQNKEHCHTHTNKYVCLCHKG